MLIDHGLGNPLGSWNGSAYTGTLAIVASGRNGGGWNGSGIITSMTAAAAPGTLATIGISNTVAALGLTSGQTAVWDGFTVDSTCVLLRYTFTGDENLDGVINGDDYFAIDAGFAGTQPSYAKGDLNYDGRINADDYFLIDSNYNKARAPLAAGALPLSVASVELPPSSYTHFADQPIDSAYDRLIDPPAASDSLL
jgi:hypothetical protein